MDNLPLYCYSLNRLTAAQDVREYKLPCSLDDAFKFLALFFGVKSLLLPTEINLAYAIPHSPFFVRQVPTEEVVNYTFDSLYPMKSERRGFHFIRRMLARVLMMKQLTRREKIIPETIFEVFATANKLLLNGPLPETVDDRMLLARFHFYPVTNATTYVHIYYGWHAGFDMEAVQLLYDIINGYLRRLHHLFGPDVPGPTSTANYHPDDATWQTSKETSPTLNNQSVPFQVEEKPIHMDALREETEQIIDPPRIYPGSLAKICRMVCLRQRQIEAGSQIQDIEVIRSKVGPSINTLRKLPELVANWTDPHYRWYADIWLRQQSGHAPHEITKLLNELWEKLTGEDWTVVIANGKGKGSVSQTSSSHNVSLRPELSTAVS